MRSVITKLELNVVFSKGVWEFGVSTPSNERTSLLLALTGATSRF